MAKIDYRVNEDITAKEIRLIDKDGKQVGLMTLSAALDKARNYHLDLVEIAPQAKPPVCKIIDYGKFVYELQKKEKIQRKNQSVTVLKEIRLHPNTDTHDLAFKARHAIGFIENGNKVKVSVFFKGRQLAYTDIGKELLQKFLDELSDVAKIEQPIKFEGRTMFAILAPLKGKKKK